MRFLSSLVFPLIFSGLAWAAAVPAELHTEPAVAIAARQGVTTLSQAALSAITPYVQFARAAYCPTSKIAGWSCGGNVTYMMSLEIMTYCWLQRLAQLCLGFRLR